MSENGEFAPLGSATLGLVELDRATCEQARRSRDARFDGKIFIAVRTTGIYCRPVCPAPSPKEANVAYYASAAAAASAGYRPCLRCRPESSPGSAPWNGSGTTVGRGLRLISEGALDQGDVEGLAGRLGVSGRHLRRLFLEHLGATPVEVAQTRRMHFAKKLIDETRLPFTEVALASGFGSLRRFHAVFQQRYGRTPRQLRAFAGRMAGAAGEWYRFRLAYRPPYDWPGILGFLEARAIPGIEAVADGEYRRAIEGGEIAVRAGDRALELRVRHGEPARLLAIVERVRRMFDLAADPAAIVEALRRDRILGPRVRRRPGIRVPGCWDGFELAVRAILGQQVSVAAASTMAGRMVAKYGALAPAALAEADLESIGLIGQRAETIRALARSGLEFSGVGDPAGLMDALRGIRGIGDWTAQYIAMRALSEPDAFPAADLVLVRNAGATSAKELLQWSEAWRPWRAYAAMHLWLGGPA